MSAIPYSNFTKGELAPELQARIDTNQYAAGAKRVRNWIIQRYGGLSFRPGFRVVGEVDSLDETLRYIPFQYNIEQAYVLTIGNEGMRLLAGGGFLTEENVNITDIAKAVNNAQVTQPFHGYLVGDRIYFSGITGMVELNGQVGRVTAVIDADNYLIDINTSGYGTFLSSDGTVRVGAPPPPPTPPAPPPVPTPQPEPPTTTGDGGSGSDIGNLPGSGNDGLIEF